MTTTPGVSGGAAAGSPPASTGTGPVGQGDCVVREGDCVSSIARNTGHFWGTIWNEPANAELKQARSNPNILLPGDRVTVPLLRPKQEPGQTELRHRFVRKGEPARLRLRVLDNDQPRANEPYTIEIDGHTYEGTTDPNGNLECLIPGNARRGRLRIGQEGDEFELELGANAPITEVRGIQARLSNLGFDCGTVDGVLGPRTQSALRGFQVMWDLEATGEPDDATRSKLQEVHGS